MNSESAANGVATFLRLARPINFSPLQITAAVQTIPFSPALANRNFQLAAFSTGLIGTGLALSVFYPAIFNGGHHGYALSANDSFTWLEYPAEYVSPVMDLFVEDQVPFGVSSPLSCPKDSEHLERAFDFLQYQHLLKRLGVSSAINQRTLVRLFRILGNTSSGSSFEFLAAAKLARLEKNADGEPSYMAIVNSTRLPPVSDEELKREPASHWAGISTATLMFFAITFFGLRHTTLKNIREVQDAGSDGDVDKDNEIAAGDDESSSSHPTTCPTTAIVNSTRLPPASGNKELKGEPTTIMSSLVVATTVFGLLAQRRRAQRPSPSPPTTPENILEVQDVQQAVSDTNVNDGNVCCKDCAPVPFKKPSFRLALGVFINLDHWQSVERLLDNDPLSDSYTPCVVLKFLDDDSPVRSDVGLPEDASAPDGFAAQFDAPQDNLLSFQTLQYMVEHLPTPHDLARFIVFGTAILACFSLRVTGFLVTGRFGRRGIKQLIKRFKNAKLSDATLAVDDEGLSLQLVETPARQENVPPVGGSEVSSSNPAGIQDAKIVAAMITPQPSCSTSTPATPVGTTVETFLAPVVHTEKFEVKDDEGCIAVNMRSQKGKGKPAVPEDDEPVEPLSRPHKRSRGRRGRGRRSPEADDV